MDEAPERIGLVRSPFGFRLWNHEEDNTTKGAIQYVRADLFDTLAKERDALDAECQQFMLDISRDRERAENAEAARDTLAKENAELREALAMLRDNNRKGATGTESRQAWQKVNALLERGEG